MSDQQTQEQPQIMNGCCGDWADDGFLKLNHHHNCSRYNETHRMDVRVLLGELCKGIENWANDEDGVHPDCWDAYRNAKLAIGQHDFIEPTE